MKRRAFLQSAGAAGVGLGLASLGTARAQGQDTLGPEAVQFRPEIEPIVRWVEETPRDKIVEQAAERIKSGLSYNDLMAAIFLAGIRNVRPHPVGFKFHTVLSLHSAHVIARTSAPADQLYPLFWALDTFKGSQAADVREGDWTLSKVDETRVPTPDRAKAALAEALEAWDEEASNLAAAGLCRVAGAAETMETFWRYGLRDQRDIGHKAIFAMQCWRTLQTIGWQHAEPVLRSLASGILDRRDDDRSKEPVGPYRANVELAKTIRPDWMIGKQDSAATVELLGALRQASPEAASAEAAKLLNAGIDPGTLWDAINLSAHEILMRKPAILAIHAVTSANALHYCYQTSGDDTTRRLALLQAAGWMPLYRSDANENLRIDRMEVPESKSEEVAVPAIFDAVSDDRARAASLAMGYFAQGGQPDAFFQAARSLVTQKGRDSHDYKFGAATVEECALLTDPRWRAPLASASLFNFQGAKAQDSPAIVRARAAFGA